MRGAAIGVQAAVYGIAFTVITLATWEFAGIQTGIGRVLLGTAHIYIIWVLDTRVTGAGLVAVIGAAAITRVPAIAGIPTIIR